MKGNRGEISAINEDDNTLVSTLVTFLPIENTWNCLDFAYTNTAGGEVVLVAATWLKKHTGSLSSGRRPP